MNQIKTLTTTLLFTSLIQGCSTPSHVHDLGADNYMIESYYNPKSDTDKRNAMVVLKRRAENACEGTYQVVDQFVEPDFYWGDFVVRWEVSCNAGLYRTTI